MSKSKCAGRTVQHAVQWIDYFQQRAVDAEDLPWSNMVRLTPEERQRVLPSIAIFQLGESGEGRHLFRAAWDWAEKSGDHDYVAALRLFIEEEHRHARILGRYLDLAQFSRLETNWTDGVFRRLRKFAGLELAITVLLTAELVAMVYYAALRRASGCPLLEAICRQVLEDECGHIRFQSQQIGRIRAAREPWQAAAGEALQTALLSATSMVVWWTHRPVFLAAGLNYLKFVQKLWGQFRASLTVTRTTCVQTKAEKASFLPAAQRPRPCPA